jgi:hypothetical protein
MDNPDNLDVLLDWGEAAAERKVRDGDFPRPSICRSRMEG